MPRHETEHEPFEKIKRRAKPAFQQPIKQRFEQHGDVQRWLATQIPQIKTDKPPFDPPFLSEHHERVWLISSLEAFYQRDLITDVVSVAKSGKEATVYCCAADPSTTHELLAAKIYRPRMFRSLKNDKLYRLSRASLNEQGHFDRRARISAHNGSERGRNQQVAAWIQHEYQVQQRVHAAGGDVPAVFDQAGSAILMAFIGDSQSAAPLLLHADVEPADAPRLFANTIRNIELFLACDVIHGDLSPYNVLYWQNELVFIDFAQAVDPRYNLDVFEFLLRDVDRMCAFFARYGVESDPLAIAQDLWLRYLRT